MNALLTKAVTDLVRRCLAPVIPLALGCAFRVCAESLQAASPPTGTAPVLVPAGGFAIDGNLLANTRTNGVGDWVTNACSGGSVLLASGAVLVPNHSIHVLDAYDE